jgi:hypothetical protein
MVPTRGLRRRARLRELLTVIQDATHEDHERLLESLGDRFDPKGFDRKRVKFDDPPRRQKLASRRPARSPPWEASQRSPPRALA